MKHTFRLNVNGKGYTLYSKNDSSKYQECPLDTQSKYIYRNYLDAQKRIDALLETQAARWSICIANNNKSDNLVTAYGCLLPISDDKGRIGISFIHAIESGKEISVEQVVILIGCLLSQKNVERIGELISGVAQGHISENDLIEFFTSHFRLSSNNLLPSSFSLERVPIKEIQQDCGGASLVTWLAMAISHSDAQSPWEIYEQYSRQTDTVSTISSFDSAKEIYLLSEYIGRMNYIRKNNLNQDQSKQKHDSEEKTGSNLSMADIDHENKNKKSRKGYSLIHKIFILNLAMIILTIVILINQAIFNMQYAEKLENTIVEIKSTIKYMRR